MPRWVSVAYLTPVYAIVDIDAEPDEGAYPDGSIQRVQHGDSEVTRLDDLARVKGLISQPVLGPSYTTVYGDDEENVDPDTLTDEERAKAFDVAENTMWPAWEGY